MIKASYKQIRRPHWPRSLTTVITAAALLVSLLVEYSSACNVTNADIWAGKTQSEANNKVNHPDIPIYICTGSTAYFYAECSAQADPEHRQLKWTYTFGDGGSTTHYTAWNDYTDTANHQYTSADAYTVTLTVERVDVSNSSYRATCKVTVVPSETLVLRDKATKRSVADEANDGPPPPGTLYVDVAADDKGDVEFWILDPEVGETYNWEIQTEVASGSLTGTSEDDYKAEYHNLDPGDYTLRLTKEGDSAFERKIKFIVYSIGIILTFDDGPHAATTNNYTQMVMDTLAVNSVENGIKAAFFVQTHVPYRGGSSVGQQKITAMENEGHQVEIHTGSTEDHVYHTVRVTAAPYDVDGDGNPDGQNGLESDLIRAKKRINTLTGGTPAFVRPPGGAYNQAVLSTYQRVNLTIKMWDVDSTDSSPGATVESIKNALRSQITSKISAAGTKLIILFHDIKSITANNLDEFLQEIADSVEDAGYVVGFELL